MVKANEIRRGNIFGWKDKIIVVGCVDMMDNILIMKALPESTVRELGMIIRQGLNINQLLSIPLTPKILIEWCGFEKGVNSDFRLIDWFDLDIDENGFSFSCAGIGIGMGIKYLHQLQNLYFALIGKELELQIPEIK